jgi:hypothetical protein
MDRGPLPWTSKTLVPNRNAEWRRIVDDPKVREYAPPTFHGAFAERCSYRSADVMDRLKRGPRSARQSPSVVSGTGPTRIHNGSRFVAPFGGASGTS